MNTAFDLTDSDRHILSLTDDDFILHDWDNLVSIIGISLSLHTAYYYIHTLTNYIYYSPQRPRRPQAQTL